MLKSPKIKKKNVFGVNLLQRVMQVAIEGLFTPVSACRVGAYTLRKVANMLSWIGSLRDMVQSE